MTKHERYLNRAAVNASESDCRIRVGACLVGRRGLVCDGLNSMKTHPLLTRYGYHPESGIHAEMRACIGVDYTSLVGATIYVARLLRNGGRALARPCECCAHFLTEAGIKRVYFTTEGDGMERMDLG